MVRFNLYNTGAIVPFLLLSRAHKSVVDLLYLLFVALKTATTKPCSPNFEHGHNQTNLTRATAQPTNFTSRTMNSADQITANLDELCRRIQPLFNQARWCLTLNFDEKSNYNSLFRQSNRIALLENGGVVTLHRIRGKSTNRRQYICSTCP